MNTLTAQQPIANNPAVYHDPRYPDLEFIPSGAIDNQDNNTLMPNNIVITAIMELAKLARHEIDRRNRFGAPEDFSFQVICEPYAADFRYEVEIIEDGGTEWAAPSWNTGEERVICDAVIDEDGKAIPEIRKWLEYMLN